MFDVDMIIVNMKKYFACPLLFTTHSNIFPCI